jgi:hypothetical protein
MGGARGTHFWKDELMHLLHILDKLCPIGGIEWDEVVLQHQTKFPNCNKETLQRKFLQLHNAKPPTIRGKVCTRDKQQNIFEATL